MVANSEPKQVILARRDLQMSPGKLAAQVAHASLGAVTDLLEWDEPVDGATDCDLTVTFEVAKLVTPSSGPLDLWLNGTFTKVVLGVNSQEELLKFYELADKEGLLCKLILDSGRTEFDGKPTYTCVAIGPAFPEQLDKLTGHLKLY